MSPDLPTMVRTATVTQDLTQAPIMAIILSHQVILTVQATETVTHTQDLPIAVPLEATRQDLTLPTPIVAVTQDLQVLLTVQVTEAEVPTPDRPQTDHPTAEAATQDPHPIAQTATHTPDLQVTQAVLPIEVTPAPAAAQDPAVLAAATQDPQADSAVAIQEAAAQAEDPSQEVVPEEILPEDKIL